MYEIKTYYNTLERIEKILFKEKIMKHLGINYTTFYVWLSRNTIPKNYRDKYNEIVEQNEYRMKVA